MKSLTFVIDACKILAQARKVSPLSLPSSSSLSWLFWCLHCLSSAAPHRCSPTPASTVTTTRRLRRWMWWSSRRRRWTSTPTPCRSCSVSFISIIINSRCGYFCICPLNCPLVVLRGDAAAVHWPCLLCPPAETRTSKHWTGAYPTHQGATPRHPAAFHPGLNPRIDLNQFLKCFNLWAQKINLVFGLILSLFFSGFPCRLSV